MINIQSALNAAKSGGTVIIPEGVYSVTSPLIQTSKNLTIRGEGAVTLNLDVGSAQGMQLGGTLVTSQALSSNVLKGSSQVVLRDASSVRQGDLIRIWKNVKWCPLDYPDQTTGELYKVKSVSGNVIALNEPLLRDYSLSDTVKTEVFRPIEVHIENIRFQNKDSKGVREGLALRYCKDSSVSNCWFKDNGQASLRLFTCFNVNVKNNEMYNSVHEGNGYGVSVADTCAFVTIEDNHIENCRHTIMSGTGDFKALNRGVVINRNTLIGGALTGAQVVDAHPMTIDYLVTNNKIYPKPAYIAFLDGAYRSEFSGNEVYGGYGTVARRGSVNGGVHVIKNNFIKSGYIYGGIGTGTSEALVIKDNHQEACTYHYLFNLNTESFKNIVVSGNTFKNVDAAGIALTYLINGVNLEISNNTFENVKSTAISVNGNSHTNGKTIIRDNKFTNVGGKISLTGITASETGSIDIPGEEDYQGSLADKYANRLREAAPETVYKDPEYIDVGGTDGPRWRDVIYFDLSEYAGMEDLTGTLSLNWYYPEGKTRTQDTVIEIYRPAYAWHPDHTSWINRVHDKAWNNPGGDWYDKNGVSQGSTPYASITIKGSSLPDNKYYDLDVSGLVGEYLSGKYENTGFLIKARSEGSNYIAFRGMVAESKPLLTVRGAVNETVMCGGCGNGTWVIKKEEGVIKILCEKCLEEY